MGTEQGSPWTRISELMHDGMTNIEVAKEYIHRFNFQSLEVVM
jgi:hypothetical protein